MAAKSPLSTRGSLSDFSAMLASTNDIISFLGISADIKLNKSPYFDMCKFQACKSKKLRSMDVCKFHKLLQQCKSCKRYRFCLKEINKKPYCTVCYKVNSLQKKETKSSTPTIKDKSEEKDEISSDDEESLKALAEDLANEADGIDGEGDDEEDDDDDEEDDDGEEEEDDDGEE
jgi:hypothetical protein